VSEREGSNCRLFRGSLFPVALVLVHLNWNYHSRAWTKLAETVQQCRAKQNAVLVFCRDIKITLFFAISFLLRRYKVVHSHASGEVDIFKLGC